MRTAVSTNIGQYDSSDDNNYTKSLLDASSDDESMATRSTCGHCRKDKTTNKDKTSNKKVTDEDSGKRNKKNNYPH